MALGTSPNAPPYGSRTLLRCPSGGSYTFQVLDMHFVIIAVSSVVLHQCDYYSHKGVEQLSCSSVLIRHLINALTLQQVYLSV